MLTHGGNVAEAAKQFNIPVANWIDLSTGINPYAWPVPTVPEKIWQHLPDSDAALINVAEKYYNASQVLPVAGSQAAIQLLPKLRDHARVAVLAPTYSEHPYAWQQAGHDVHLLSYQQLANHVDSFDVVIVVNPNNPTGKLIDKHTLLNWHQQLQSENGWLIVDEAFMDALPENTIETCSVAQHTDNHLIVLRSVGKFFGMAGLRLGFVLANPTLLHDLQEQLGPWTVTGPGQHLGISMLQDSHWQQHMRDKLNKLETQFIKILNTAGLAPQGHTPLFYFLQHDHAYDIYTALAEQGILVRYFPEISALRFGLARQQQFQRLAELLDMLKAPLCETPSP